MILLWTLLQEISGVHLDPPARIGARAAMRHHLEDRVILNGGKTVVFMD